MRFSVVRVFKVLTRRILCYTKTATYLASLLANALCINTHVFRYSAIGENHRKIYSITEV